MQTNPTMNNRLYSVAQAATRAIQQAAQNVWNACLAEAQSEIHFGTRATTAIGSAASAVRAARTTRRTRRTSRSAPRTTGRRSAAPKALSDAETQVLAALPTSGFVSQSAIFVPGMRPNIIGRALGTLARKGYITGEKGGSWRRTAEQMAAAD